MKCLAAFSILFLACMTSSAQSSILGIIDIYGAEKINEADIRKVIGIREGDEIPSSFSRDSIARKLKTIPGVKDSHVALVCCDDKMGKRILFIGIAENNKNAFTYYTVPSGSAFLPDSIIKAYQDFGGIMMEAVQKGQATEDDSKSYSWLNYPAAAPVQEKFLQYARQNVPVLKKVLRNSVNAIHRAVAAWILPYADNKKEITEELLHAIYDPEDEVRNNATRALSILARYSGNNPNTGIKIPASPFIAMIRSIIWTDRNKGAAVLEALTRKPDSSLLKQLKKEALPPLLEMSAWKNPGHALFSLVILGRITGIPDEKVFAAVELDQKEELIEKILTKLKN